MAVVGSFLLGIRVVLAAVFAVAGVAKLLDRRGTRRSLSEFGVPSWSLPIATLLLPLLELAIAVALIPPSSARWGALAAMALLLGFIVGIANALARGEAPDCHCFGQVHSAPAGRSALARNAGLAAFAAVIVWEGPGPSIPEWVSSRTAAELVAVAAGAAAVGLAALAQRLWSDRRSLREELAAARAKLAAVPPGLPVGARAPEFALRDLHGETRTLDSLRARGLPIVLVFLSPGCGPCRMVFPEISRWQAALADQLTVMAISTGTVAENVPIAGEHEITEMLVQDAFEVADAFRLRMAPSALVVAADGTVASAPVQGVLPIEHLIRLTLRRSLATSAARPIATG